MTDTPLPGSPEARALEESPLTEAEWRSVHAACIRAELDPDPSQISLLDDASPSVADRPAPALGMGE